MRRKLVENNIFQIAGGGKDYPSQQQQMIQSSKGQPIIINMPEHNTHTTDTTTGTVAVELPGGFKLPIELMPQWAWTLLIIGVVLIVAALTIMKVIRFIKKKD